MVAAGGVEAKEGGGSGGGASGVRWDGSRLGPDCVVTGGGAEVTRTNSSCWGVQVADTW